MKCPVCNSRKGKRNCPVKDAPICPACCGENRVVVFACPEDCAFLKRHEDYQVSRMHQIYARSEDPRNLRRWLKVLKENGALYSAIQEAIVAGSVERNAENEDIKDTLKLMLRTYESEDAGVHYVQKSASARVETMMTAVRDRVENLRKMPEPGSVTGSPAVTLTQTLETLEVILNQLEFFDTRGERFSEYLRRIHPTAGPDDSPTDSPLILS